MDSSAGPPKSHAGAIGGMPERLRREPFSRSVARDFGTHRRPNCEMLHCGYCNAFVSEVAMIDVVDRILSTYQSMCPLDAERATDSRQKISRYIENLTSASQRDAEQLTVYGLAYLAELHEGHDPQFTGC
jgi:hypothetical protein